MFRSLLFSTATAALLAGALFLAPVPAAAQSNDQPQAGQGTQPMQGNMKDRRMMRVEQHIAELHRRLHITAAEEPQWNAFAQIMRDNALHMDQAFQARAAQGPNMSAVDDLKSYAAVAQAHAEDMQRLVPAFESLYSALSPQQQKTADEVFRDFEQRRGRPHAG